MHRQLIKSKTNDTDYKNESVRITHLIKSKDEQKAITKRNATHYPKDGMKDEGNEL
jgi:hypothetical protein